MSEVKFIKVRGRIIPIRGKDTPEKKAARSIHKVGGGAAITGALLAGITGVASKATAITAKVFALSAVKLPKSNPARMVLADKAVKQAKLSMKLSKVNKGAKVATLLGIGASVASLSYLMNKNYKRAK